MKLNEEFITHETKDEQIMVSAGGSGFSGLVKSNATAAFIVNCLKNEITEEEIISKMLEEYDAPREVIAGDVRKILDKLRSIGALNE